MYQRTGIRGQSPQSLNFIGFMIESFNSPMTSFVVR